MNIATERWQRRMLGLILVTYVVLAVIYISVVPVNEAPDEPFHFQMIAYIIDHNTLPIQRLNKSETIPSYAQEGSQPPLYYWLLSKAPGSEPTWTYNNPTVPNPFAQIGIGQAQINQNAYLPWWLGEPFGTHMRVLRLISTTFGLITLFALYQLIRAALQKFKSANILALMAVAFVAFNPMFLFIHGSINNDTLITMLATLALWRMVMRLQGANSLWETVILSIILGLGAITKLSGLTLYGMAGVMLIILLVQRQITVRRLILDGLIITLGFLVIAAWWYLRNWELYSELTGTRMMIAVIGARQFPYTLVDFLREMEGLRISSWALFGWLNVIGPDWFLKLMDWLTLAGLIGGIGWIVQLMSRQQWREFRVYGFLGLYFVVMFASLINWTSQTPGTQGRLLFPAISVIALLTASGWYMIGTWLASRVRFGQLISVLPLGVMASVAALAPYLTIAPAYFRPRIVDSVPEAATKYSYTIWKLPPDSQRIIRQFKQEGAVIDHNPVLPGGILPVTLYLAAFLYGGPTLDNHTLYITIYGCNGEVLGKVDSFPGGGDLPGIDWPSGVIVKDNYPIQLSVFSDDLCQPLIETGWYDFPSKRPLGEKYTFRAGLLVQPTRTPLIPATLKPVTFSGALQFNGYTLPQATVKRGESLPVALNWQALSQVYEDFTVFVHLESSDQKTILTADSPPKNGDYPTSVWLPGVAFADTHTLSIPPETPPGTYTLKVGLYRSRDLTRLPITIPENGGDSLTLQTIEVQ